MSNYSFLPKFIPSCSSHFSFHTYTHPLFSCLFPSSPWRTSDSRCLCIVFLLFPNATPIVDSKAKDEHSSSASEHSEKADDQEEEKKRRKIAKIRIACFYQVEEQRATRRDRQIKG